MGSRIILCNGASGRPGDSEEALELRTAGKNPNVRIELPRFAEQLSHVPTRLLDLLEIASHVYAADRLVGRGSPDAVLHESWSRDLTFRILVRDAEFWESEASHLSELLVFLSGDRSIRFEFEGGRADDGQTTIFSQAESCFPPEGPETKVVLFSGGLDSLAGALEVLQEPSAKLLLVSHSPGSPTTARTQKALVRSLRERFPGRTILHFRFTCCLTKEKAIEETQRTRSFLYASIGFVLARTDGLKSLLVFENGVTSMNFQKREDMGSARSSRTTHPRTIRLLEAFFRRVAETDFRVETPFASNTKAEVVAKLQDFGAADLIDSTVSCGHTRSARGSTTHCGVCSQCVDRRFAMFSVGLQEHDHSGLYALDFLTQRVSDGSAMTTIRDYVRFASEVHDHSLDSFASERIMEVVDIVDPSPATDDFEKVQAVFDLLRRHSDQVSAGYDTMRAAYADVRRPVPSGSIFELLDSRPHLRPIPDLAAARIADELTVAIPLAFQRHEPAHENELNDFIEAHCTPNSDSYRREFPSVWIGLAKAVPDHFDDGFGLIIEGKLVRSQGMAKLTDEICADLVKYAGIQVRGEPAHILFVV